METKNSIKDYFVEHNLTLGSCESFTGGLFASTITSISGASKFYKGSFITYATEEKNKLLQIPNETIEQFGVVSKEIAFHMANNARHLLGVDVCVSFTGNAGPEAMENKPVGEVHIGIVSAEKAEIYSLNLKGTRDEIRQQAVEFALQKLTTLK